MGGGGVDRYGPPGMSTSQAETGRQITNSEVAAALNLPGQTLVDDSGRVAAGEWAYWPATASATGRNLLLHKSPVNGQILLICYGASPEQICKGSYDLPPVPEAIQQAARRG